MSRPGERVMLKLPARQHGPAANAANAVAGAIDEERFAEDLGLMLNAGPSLMDSLKTLRERGASSVAHPLAGVITRLTQGETLSQAMQGSNAFRPALIACVKASEMTGDLVASLARYASNAARLRAMKTRMVSALVYPLLLVSVAACVVVFLLVYVVPRFALVLESSGRDMPASSQALISVGRALHAVPKAAWLLLLALWGGQSIWQAARECRLEASLSAWAGRIPGVRGIVRGFGHSQFARSGAMLVRSGMPALKALAMCRELLVGADRQGLDLALATASAGAPLAAAMHQQNLVDMLDLRVLRVAEQTGALEAVLERLADLHDRDLERTLDRVGRLIEPLLMLGIGLVVGGIVVLMYLPIFQLAANI